MHETFREGLKSYKTDILGVFSSRLIFLPFLPVSVQFLTNASVHYDGRKTSFAAYCDASPSVRRTVHRTVSRLRRERRRGERAATPFASRARRHSSPETTILTLTHRGVSPEGGPTTRQCLGVCFSLSTPASNRARGSRDRDRVLPLEGSRRARTIEISPRGCAETAVEGLWRTSRVTAFLLVEPRSVGRGRQRTFTPNARARTRMYTHVYTGIYAHAHAHARARISG